MPPEQGPSETGGNGRDAKGRFGAGNKAAKGNPNAAKVARLRQALLGAVTEKDIGDVVAALIEQAKKGDVPAIKELLDRTIGKAVTFDDAGEQEAPMAGAVIEVKVGGWRPTPPNPDEEMSDAEG